MKRHRKKTRRGSPISKLPEELLLEIFAHLPNYAARRRRGRDCPPHWLSVTRVCTLWRRVALACPDLWRFIPLESEPWTQAALKHSKDALITIRAAKWPKPSTLEDPYAKQLALEHISRAREITLVDFNNNISYGVTVNCNSDESSPKPSPHLEVLRLRVDIRSCTGLRLSGVFDEIPTPKLRDLRLHNLFIRWTSPLLQSTALTHLELQVQEIPALRTWDCVEDLAQTLSRMPLLHTLVLLNVFPPNTAVPPGLLPERLDFPHLATIRFAGSSIMEHILACIAAPACVEFALVLNTDYVESPLPLPLPQHRMPDALTTFFSRTGDKLYSVKLYGYGLWGGRTQMFNTLARISSPLRRLYLDRVDGVTEDEETWADLELPTPLLLAARATPMIWDDPEL
ncbi:hypothetical protein BV25DRAFT_1826428 [Artomyces pyxidatus]|uniref:Uncharacterized protein n=1 Tax=Artomyces pyxidatus TaxID=48021 RepID=A0ACB8SZS4_9AGAM|nr:hypothetical protein BV25DRAFT_1826428 [Artomyces pyxidatus]